MPVYQHDSTVQYSTVPSFRFVRLYTLYVLLKRQQLLWSIHKFQVGHVILFLILTGVWAFIPLPEYNDTATAKVNPTKIFTEAVRQY